MKEPPQPTKPSESSQPPGSNLSLRAFVSDVLVYVPVMLSFSSSASFSPHPGLFQTPSIIGRHYAISAIKANKELGWQLGLSFDRSLTSTIQGY